MRHIGTISAKQLADDLRTVNAFMDTMIREEITFEKARILMCGALGITLGESADRLRLYEEISGKQLKR